jgi:hypothetical protein
MEAWGSRDEAVLAGRAAVVLPALPAVLVTTPAFPAAPLLEAGRTALVAVEVKPNGLTMILHLLSHSLSLSGSTPSVQPCQTHGRLGHDHDPIVISRPDSIHSLYIQIKTSVLKELPFRIKPVRDGFIWGRNLSGGLLDKGVLRQLIHCQSSLFQLPHGILGDLGHLITKCLHRHQAVAEDRFALFPLDPKALAIDVPFMKAQGHVFRPGVNLPLPFPIQHLVRHPKAIFKRQKVHLVPFDVLLMQHI